MQLQSILHVIFEENQSPAKNETQGALYPPLRSPFAMYAYHGFQSTVGLGAARQGQARLQRNAAVKERCWDNAKRDTSPLKAAHITAPHGSFLLKERQRKPPADNLALKPSFMTVMLLVELLGSLTPCHTLSARQHAAQLLQQLSRVEVNRGTLCKLPGATAKLAFLLWEEYAELRENAARILCNLCCGKDTNKNRIGKEPRAVAGLCYLLHAPEPATRAAAAAALSNLAHNHVENQLLIGRQPGAVAALVAMLAEQQQQPARVRIAATRAVECLAPHNQDVVAKTPGALQVLAACLSDTEAAVRASAAAALQHLAWLHAGNPAVIVHGTPGVLSGLTALLRDPDNPRARDHAAAAVAHLGARDNTVRAALAGQPGLLTGLAGLLLDANACIRAQAAVAVKCLAVHNVEVQTRFGSMCWAMRALMDMLQYSDGAVRQQAAECLKSLAAGHTANWFMIRKLSLALEMRLLSYILSP